MLAPTPGPGFAIVSGPITGGAHTCVVVATFCVTGVCVGVDVGVAVVTFVAVDVEGLA